MVLASFGKESGAWMTGNYTDDRRIAASSSPVVVDDGGVAVPHNRIHSPDERVEMASSENLVA